jgi:putative peptidoglycan lipid II flippase
VTGLAVAAAPLLTGLVVGDSTGAADLALATVFAFLLLPQIACYGLAALLTAILNARNRFAPGAWAPVLNNVVLLATFGWYRLIPGRLTVHSSIIDPHVLVLGIGSTAGVASQAAVLVPCVLRAGVRPRWRWGWDRRMAEWG